MDEKIESAAEALVERYDARASTFRGQTSLIVAADYIQDCCRRLRDDFGFDMLSEETAVDYWPQQSPRFHIVYFLYSIEKNVRIGLRVPLDGNAPSLPSIEPVYPNANWHERELWDMFGIQFEGHTDLRRIVMPYDWEGHPLRKDYPLGYEEVQFTFNFDEINRRKRYAKE